MAMAALLLLATTAVRGSGAAAPAVTAVASVDLLRYQGFWHEIARVPNRFQRRCARDTFARYRLRPGGDLEVLNQCRRRNGGVEQASGIARVSDRQSQARLRVSLVSVLGWRPFWGDYWIIGLDPAYGWAVVGEPDRRFGWVLSRSRSLDADTLRSIRTVLISNGYEPSRFLMGSVRPGSPSSPQTLSDAAASP